MITLEEETCHMGYIGMRRCEGYMVFKQFILG